MFTGIITDIGQVREIAPRSAAGDLRLAIETRFDLTTLTLGASVCCSGVCLTVVDRGAARFAVDVSGETLSRTTLGGWSVGTRVNLERALKAGDELGGHIVTGHVDGVAEVAATAEEGGSLRLDLAVPRELARFLASKGSVALDGVSLTVNEVRDQAEGSTVFAVNIIPHTRTATTLGDVKTGQRVNVEVDPLARYVARLIQRS